VGSLFPASHSKQKITRNSESLRERELSRTTAGRLSRQRKQRFRSAKARRTFVTFAYRAGASAEAGFLVLKEKREASTASGRAGHL